MSAIKKGDLVMVVRGRECCGWSSGYGLPFTVGNINSLPTTCDRCGVTQETPVAVIPGRRGLMGGAVAVEISRLIRIDGGPLTESTPERKEVTA